jgi:general secretion pathway protein G
MTPFRKRALWATALALLTLLAVALCYSFFFTGLSVPRTKIAQADLIGLATQLRAYAVETGSFPTTEQGLEALVTRPIAPPIPAHWSPRLDRMIVDPWQHPYVYHFPSPTHSTDFDLFSLGPDGIESADDIRFPR